MDTMKISSKLITGLVSKALAKLVKSKVGYDVNLDIKKLTITVEEGKSKLHLETDAEMTTSELIKLVAKGGIA